ncbi:toll-like receptor 4 [Mytilus trossulus]|uniref:toll-like receptor 4 n=1 Tax=Mytilus trossulus TaxID=6551 RepID=UPI0030048F24
MSILLMISLLELLLLPVCYLSGNNTKTTCAKCDCNKKVINCANHGLNRYPNFSLYKTVRTINFSHNNLEYMPDANLLPDHLLILDLSFNKINRSENYSLSELKTLQQLNLRNNSFHTVLDGRKLPESVIYLDLSVNKINSFGTYPFVNSRKLQVLDLHRNLLSYNRTVFKQHVFNNLQSLTKLNIGQNGYDTTEPVYPDEVFQHLKSLHTLVIDGFSTTSFGKVFSNMKNLQVLSINNLMLPNLGIETITENYFENLSQITALDISLHRYIQINTSGSEVHLKSIESGAIAKLTNLRSLDISFNSMLGFCGLRNITQDLPKTDIKVLKANQIYCPYGFSTILFVDDIKPLKDTNLTKLYLDGNRLEMTEDLAPTYLPKTLRVLSLMGNRLRLEKYKIDGIFTLTGIHSLFLSFQDQTQSQRVHSGWFVCNDFIDTLNCLSDRKSWMLQKQNGGVSAKQRQESYESDEFGLIAETYSSDYVKYVDSKNFPKIRYIQSYPHITAADIKPYQPLATIDNPPPDCTFDPLISFVNAIPPNTKQIFYESSNLGDIIIPFWMSNDILENISLRGNNFQNFQGPVCNVTNVKILDLSENKCLNIFAHFFIGFINLEKLFLQGNLLGDAMKTFEHGELFEKKLKLKMLNISSNRITTLPNNFFAHVPNIKTIDISHNLLTDWNVTISHLWKLNIIDLSYNQITFLSDKAMKKLDKSTSQHMNINMMHNPFECSCDSLSFLLWYKKNRKRMGSYSIITCKNSKRELIYVEDVLLILQKQCNSKVGLLIGAGLFLFVSLGSIFGAIAYRYRIRLRYSFHMFKRQYFGGYEPLHVNQNYAFDAFISYADHDRQFVINRLIELEQKKGKRLCIHHRDFIPGNEIAENIINGIHHSKKTICVITREFLRSTWCNYEFNIARTEGICSRERENIIIVILMEDIPFKEIPIRIMEVIIQETYLSFAECLNDDDTFLDLLATAIEN